MARNLMIEATDLIKKGEKKAAAKLLQELLIEDKTNVDAWWLLSHTTDDVDRAIQYLQRGERIDPSHERTQKRLRKLREQQSQADSYLFSDEPQESTSSYAKSASTATGSQSDDDYWAKLKNPPKQPKRSSGGLTAGGIIGMLFANRLMGRITVAVVLLIGFGIYSLFLDSSTEDVNGNTPRDVIFAFEQAFWVEDRTAMMSMICPGYESYVDSIWQDTFAYAQGSTPSDLRVDMSGVTMKRIRRQPNEVTYSFHGSVTYSFSGETYTYSYDETIAAEGGNVWIGHHVKRINGEWKICDGPDEI